MATLKTCRSCQINYPGTVVASKCLICEDQLVFTYAGSVTPNWEQVVQQKLAALENGAQTVSIYPHRYDSTARIYRDAAGHLWVTHFDLGEAGYKNLEDFSIVYLNGKFYELQGYVEAAKAWWIEEVPTELDVNGR